MAAAAAVLPYWTGHKTLIKAHGIRRRGVIEDPLLFYEGEKKFVGSWAIRASKKSALTKFDDDDVYDLWGLMR